jgi:DnaJ-class molecular chaperone
MQAKRNHFMQKCENCGGSGSITIGATCHLCNGTAEVIVYEDDGSEKMLNCSNCEFGLVYTEQTCRHCHGTGKVV